MRFATSILLIIAVVAPPARAASAPEAAPAKTPTKVVVTAKPHSLSDKADLEAFFDGIFHDQLDFKHIAGAVVTVVNGNDIVLMKGYGYADIDARRPVDPETTQFRIASISKLFVWTAVMQLVEEGKLDIDKDINTYLKGMQVPATFPEPVTLKSLFTHTPGFEDNAIGLFSHTLEQTKPYDEVLRTRLPARVRPPGLLASYSNDGTALAALAVADVAGKPFEDILEQRIFGPLGMKHTFIRQPPSDKLPATISKGYRWKDGQFKDEGFEYISLAPAGAISASAGDIAHFMLAHLHDGKYGQARILKPETARRMREPLFRHDPKVDAMCHGFWEVHRNGQRILEHGGDTLVFHSLFAILPERGVGVFVSFNTDKGQTARDEILPLFMDRYFPDPQQSWPKPSTDAGDLGRFAGEYASTRHSYTTLAKVASVLGTSRVRANTDGTLSVGSEPTLKRFVPVEPLVFQEKYGPRRIVFHADSDGHITQLFIADVAAGAFERRTFLESSQFYWMLIAITAGLFASALLFWPTIAFCTRRLTTPFRKTRGSAVISVCGWLLSAACLTLVGGMIIALSDQEQLAYGLPRHLQYLLLVPQICAVLAGLVLVGCLVAWRNRYWRASSRLHYTLVALAGVAFVWFLHYSNLLTFGLQALST
ncbi:MAG TPA: serine hydrolase [Planctomycetaceae bacterium]|jgi:CubicO group peptidase (beta-lactamase class C family)|nr:serine hydrolase [Planctomycetaceae bacterium]